MREAQELGRRREFERGLVALQKGWRFDEAIAGRGWKRAPAKKESDSETSASPADKRRQEWDVRLAEVQPRFKAAVAGATCKR